MLVSASCRVHIWNLHLAPSPSQPPRIHSSPSRCAFDLHGTFKRPTEKRDESGDPICEPWCWSIYQHWPWNSPKWQICYTWSIWVCQDAELVPNQTCQPKLFGPVATPGIFQPNMTRQTQDFTPRHEASAPRCSLRVRNGFSCPLKGFVNFASLGFILGLPSGTQTWLENPLWTEVLIGNHL